MASSSTFSYAQAAKGLAPSTNTTSAAVSSASSEHGGKEEASGSQTHVKATSSDLEASGHSTSQTTSSADTHPPENASVSVVEHDTRGSSATVSSSKAAILNEADTMTVSQAEHENTSTKPSTSETAQKFEEDKAKDIDDDWEKVSVPSMTNEKELKAAPLPSVNVWQQRKEAQDAKLKDGGPQQQQQQSRATVVAPVKQRAAAPTATDESRRRTNGRDTIAEKESNSTQRRVNSGGRPSTDRKEPQPAQPASRSLSQQSSKVAAPSRPTTDTESWPTPESSAIDERRRSAVYDKGDKPDLKAGAQKKWVQMPFVPTAKFETQLPPAAARRGGRAGNRGRDVGGRGGTAAGTHVSNIEKSDAGSMGPPPLPNKVNDQDRGRKNTGAQSSRASSVPTQSHRGQSTESGTRGTTRYTIPNANDSTGHAAQPDVAPPAVDSSVGGTSNLTEDVTSQFDRSGSHRREEIRNTAQVSSGPNSASAEGAAPMHQSDRFRGPLHSGSRASVDYTDRSLAQGREWSRGRSDAPRDKAESWRGGREPRADRGRGSYRGRGNHANYNNHGSSHGYTAPLPQTGFDQSKGISSHEPRSRQASQPSFVPAQSVNPRSNLRSQSIPNAPPTNNYYNAPVAPFPQALSPLDMSFGPYPSPMHSGIMSAMPYAEPLGSYALISMIVTQLEYYFSIDNLCKDMFLRKNMDSQGFVPLPVITSFKRIRALTDGQMPLDQLRSVCQQVRNIEFVIGEDGEDRLRSRDNWRDFVLPMEERLPSAQNEGPKLASPHQLQTGLPIDFNLSNGGLRSPPAGMNGFPDQFTQTMSPMGFPTVAPFDGSAEYRPSRSESIEAEQTGRISATSPLSKLQSPPVLDHRRSASGYLSNGHQPLVSGTDLHEDAFPDEKIPELKVVVRDPAYEAQGDQDAAADAPGLRGGAASVEQIERFRKIQFGQARASSTATEHEHPSYFTKDGQIGQIPTGPGFIHEEYLPLHDKAVVQRAESHLTGALLVLYAFWSTFLVENFNLSMYDEFSTWAIEDQERGSETGKSYLMAYYEALLSNKQPMSDRLATDLVKVARDERDERRPAWQKLRTAWRNGATNLKTRKRLGDLLTNEEKAELDKSF